MKTKNLTPWCNLFSNALKLNVNIIKSRYKRCIYSAFILFIILFLLVTQTFYYLFSLVLAICFICFIGFYLTSENTLTHAVLYQISIDEQGQLKFVNHVEGFTYVDSLEISNSLYQILPSSRFSFLGLWLNLLPIKNMTDNVAQFKHTVRHVFIFRDSISAKDYACLNQVMVNLNSAIK